MKKRIDIIATIGPASRSSSILKNLKKAGMTISRLNTKYGSKKEFENQIKILKGLKVKILIDIKDELYLNWINSQNVDFVAISFAESASTITRIKARLDKKIKIISKIETLKGITNLSNLIKVSDGIMVARGDLGKNVELERLPLFQKEIILKCNLSKKMVITATEMLLSMVSSKIPERAEVSDVANAVLDGSDALMLSEETAIGKYPVLATEFMKKTIKETLKFGKKLK